MKMQKGKKICYMTCEIMFNGVLPHKQDPLLTIDLST
jgi:hypothetical protein